MRRESARRLLSLTLFLRRSRRCVNLARSRGIVRECSGTGDLSTRNRGSSVRPELVPDSRKRSYHSSSRFSPDSTGNRRTDFGVVEPEYWKSASSKTALNCERNLAARFAAISTISRGRLLLREEMKREGVEKGARYQRRN